ncbi:MAG TPA: cellulase family glycosylhydrolase, partial [archaeon]|nr:cellulase family glycosylhydrolase [archaeon]
PAAWPDHILRGANISLNITEEDISHYVNDWKANSVRILVNDMLPDTPPYKASEQKKKKVFDCIDLCLKYGLYTVFSPSASFRDNNMFFTNAEFKTRYIEFWEEIAARYVENGGGLAYDLMNEPHDSLARTQWSRYAKELTRAIREIDTLHTIVIEPPDWGWPEGFDNLEPTGDKNTVYSFHFYGPMDYTHQRNKGHMRTTEEQWRERVYPGRLQGEYWDKAKLRQSIEKAFEFRDKYAVAMWCGEFGVARWAMGAREWVKDLLDLLEEEKTGWSYYAYREWHHMDLEMDPNERVKATPRTETELVKLFKSYFAKNALPGN